MTEQKQHIFSPDEVLSMWRAYAHLLTLHSHPDFDDYQWKIIRIQTDQMEGIFNINQNRILTLRKKWAGREQTVKDQLELQRVGLWLFSYLELLMNSLRCSLKPSRPSRRLNQQLKLPL